MERIDSLNPARLEWCCRDSGVSPEELAEATDIAPKTMERALAGEAAFTFNQLSRIATFFGRGVLFFMEPGSVDPEKVYTPQFRTLANQKPELSHKVKLLIERAEGQREAYLSMRQELDDPHPAFAPPKVPANDIGSAAAIVRDWLGLDGQRTFSEYRAAVESKGVLVFRTNGYNGKWQIAKQTPILGFSLYDPVCPLIVVKKQSVDARQTFTLMHELGHVILHKTSWIDEESDLYSDETPEQHANAFAGLVLVPDIALSAIKDADRPGEVGDFDAWVRPMTSALGVSTEVALRRLLDIGRLEATHYVAYWKYIAGFAHLGGEPAGSRAYRYREPTHLFGDRFVRTVLDALSARRITIPKASGYLDGLKLKDIRRLDQHSAGL